jgi:hypothetical protein
MKKTLATVAVALGLVAFAATPASAAQKADFSNGYVGAKFEPGGVLETLTVSDQYSDGMSAVGRVVGYTNWIYASNKKGSSASVTVNIPEGTWVIIEVCRQDVSAGTGLQNCTSASAQA